MYCMRSSFEKGSSRNVNQNGFVINDHAVLKMKLWD